MVALVVATAVRWQLSPVHDATPLDKEVAFLTGLEWANWSAMAAAIRLWWLAVPWSWPVDTRGWPSILRQQFRGWLIFVPSSACALVAGVGLLCCWPRAAANGDRRWYLFFRGIFAMLMWILCPSISVVPGIEQSARGNAALVLAFSWLVVLFVHCLAKAVGSSNSLKSSADRMEEEVLGVRKPVRRRGVHLFVFSLTSMCIVAALCFFSWERAGWYQSDHSLAEAAVAASPSSAVSWWMLGEAHLISTSWAHQPTGLSAVASAEWALRRAVGLDTRITGAQLALGRLLFYRSLPTGMETTPDGATVLVRNVTAIEEAEAMLWKLVQALPEKFGSVMSFFSAPDGDKSRALWELGQLRATRGDYAAAKRLLRAACLLSPDDPVFREGVRAYARTRTLTSSQAADLVSEIESPCQKTPHWAALVTVLVPEQHAMPGLWIGSAETAAGDASACVDQTEQVHLAEIAAAASHEEDSRDAGAIEKMEL
mmetsp:Transcript_4807/g.10361  ORF Transcript_4807/g.10361 Transcript_4807/m.10361 type:complete len:484 (-) Transcript_4807:2-1453(-)